MPSQTVVQMFYTLLPLEWKRYIDDIFSLWNVDKLVKEIEEFIVLANSHYPTIKFTAEIPDKEINFLDTTVFKGERFNKQAILDICTHFKPTETFQYTHFSSCHQPGVRKGFIKGEALRLLRTNSLVKSFRREYHTIQNTPPCERLPQQSSRSNNIRSQIQ